MDQLNGHAKSLVTSSAQIPIFLDCEGHDLGKVGGKLGLVQIGVDDTVYLVDVIKYPKNWAN